MKKLAFQPAMPDFLNGRKQFTTEEANKTRCITKTRWVVESSMHFIVETFILDPFFFSK